MKTFIKLKIVLLLFVSFLFSSCELDVQDTFDFKTGAVDEDPFENITAWEFIQSKNGVNEDGTLLFEHFQYMEAAIKKAGMIEEFNQTEDTQRTYLLLNNAAMTGGGDVIEIVTGSAATTITVLDGDGNPVLDENGDAVKNQLTPEEVFEKVDTPEKLEKLRTLLKYHITLDYVQQVPTLAVEGTFYVFQTLIPGDDGLIAYRRDADWDIKVNERGAPLPNSAFSGGWNENVRNHNYVFNNGIGHIINDPVRNQPY